MNSQLDITTPAEVTALTTLERVKLELRITDDANDELLSAKINEASSDIAVRCRPSLKREGLTETFWPDHRGPHSSSDVMILRRYPVASIASVTLDDVVLDPADYRVDTGSGMLYRLSGGVPCRWWFGRTLVVVYTAGYLLPGQNNRDLPPALEAAAIELVAGYWVARGRDPALRSEEVFGVSRFDYWVGAIGEAGDLPPGVMSKIAPYAVGGFA